MLDQNLQIKIENIYMLTANGSWNKFRLNFMVDPKVMFMHNKNNLETTEAEAW